MKGHVNVMCSRPNDNPLPFKYLPRSLTKYMTEKDEEQEDNLLECGLLAKTRLCCGQGMFISSRSLNSLPSIAIQLNCIKGNCYSREIFAFSTSGECS